MLQALICLKSRIWKGGDEMRGGRNNCMKLTMIKCGKGRAEYLGNWNIVMHESSGLHGFLICGLSIIVQKFVVRVADGRWNRAGL